ncbi:hypothetical protein EDB87DRAFT_1580354 [Lactarius vividus]|nr:hypothetical protein EDB87DRAFT_1580354 [Lactarius vividus]
MHISNNAWLLAGTIVVPGIICVIRMLWRCGSEHFCLDSPLACLKKNLLASPPTRMHYELINCTTAVGGARELPGQDEDGFSPLLGAAQNGHPDVVRFLIESGADVGSRDDDNDTPLHLASREGFLPHLSSLTHLDLSSNLLVSVPPGLSSLYHLVSLNLSDNIIDSVLGILKKLSQVLALNSSWIRLDSLFGLERLVALECVNVRHNQVEESGEVGRLLLLPNISEVGVEGNAFTEIESTASRGEVDPSRWDASRVLRAKEPDLPHQNRTRRGRCPRHSPPAVPVGGVTSTSTSSRSESINDGSCPSAIERLQPFKRPSVFHQPPTIAAPPRHQRQTPEKAGEAHRAPGRRPGERERVDHSLGGAKRAFRLSRLGVALSARGASIVTPPPPAPEAAPLAAPLLAEDSTTTKAPDVVPLKHRRSHPEDALAPALTDSDDPPSPVLVSPPDRTMNVRVSARWSAARRARAAASVFEAPGKVEDGVGEEIKEADAFRAQVEAYSLVWRYLSLSLRGIVYKMPAVSFQAVLDKALADYSDQIDVELEKHPFADQLRDRDSPDDVLKLLEDKANAFRVYRDGSRKLINWLSPVVQVIHTLSGILGETVPFQLAKVIFVSVDVLITAAGGVSSSYDALVDLFECLANFLKRLRIYTDVPLTPSMTDIIVKIMVELLSVFALATKQIKQGRFKKFAKKLLGESEIEAVLWRLDRLTQEEGRMTVAQTLEVVHGLMNNVKVVMNGTQS